jgi:tetratricopeptide (TPR) repeat protein
LIGPLGLFLFVPGACGFVLARRGAWRIPSFLLLLGLTYFGASFVPRDLRLGYARDWDLFAPAGLVFTAAGLWLWLSLTERREARSVALSLALAFSLYHTAPWIAVNHSFDRSLERLKLLPLGGGRTEAAVGYWYARAGNLEQAHRWLEMGIRANPSNLPAYLVLAELDMDEGKFVEAAYAYWAASQLRPTFVSYRVRESVRAAARRSRGSRARDAVAGAGPRERRSANARAPGHDSLAPGPSRRSGPGARSRRGR